MYTIKPAGDEGVFFMPTLIPAVLETPALAAESAVPLIAAKPQSHQSQIFPSPTPTASILPMKLTKKQKQPVIDSDDSASGGLFNYFSWASKEQIGADCKHMKYEHDENVAGDKEREAAKLEKAKQCKLEMSTIQKQRQCKREKQAEIKLGK